MGRPEPPWASFINTRSVAARVRRTKVLATVGPASSSVDTLVDMIGAGMDAARVNFSHGHQREQETLVRAVRKAADEAGRPVPIVQDLQGTKIRIGSLADGGANLHRGEVVRIDAQAGQGDGTRLPVDDPGLIAKGRPGGMLLLGDGDVSLEVLSADGDTLTARVVSAGRVRSGAGITPLGMPVPGGLTAKDEADLELGIRLGLEYVALSFVQDAEDVRQARAVLDSMGGDAPLIAKIERRDALDVLPGILEAADGVLVARGDLGIALAPEEVPIAQKRILHAAAHVGKVGITATQMLESMLQSLRPTRAEASDVANAILDGTQVVMLSGETAVGSNPVAAVSMMARIAEATEKALYAEAIEANVHRGVSEGNVPDAIALACAVTAEDLDARAIVAFTRSGKTAQRVAKHRPNVPVLAATPDALVARRLNLLWGVHPMVVEEAATLDDMVRTAERSARERGLVAAGDRIVLTGGDLGVPGSTNLMRVSEIGT